MLNMDISKEIQVIDTRKKMIRYFDGYSYERMEELDERKIKKSLIKSYMLEHISNTKEQKKLTNILSLLNIETFQIDDNLYKIFDKTNNQYMGFFEVFNSRYFVFYTTHHSEISDKWIKKLVLNSPYLDHIWLSGITFNVLLKKIIQLTKPYRYISILFVYESIFQIDVEEEQNFEDEKSLSIENNDIEKTIERRASKFKLVSKISVVKNILSKLQKLYSPLYAISQIRFPSAIGRGGHDFYSYGKVTNRSGNFRDHRLHILYVQKIYENLLKMTEQKVWYSLYKEKISIPGYFQKLIGAPVIIKFETPLDKSTFDYWIKSTFNCLNNRFRLWGNPIRLGPSKVQVYGVDKHLWKPIFLEITNKNLVAILPKGTCGNTIHRLICNIQKFIDPAAKAYIGDVEYKNMVSKAVKKIDYDF